jgi:hypothetical protein
MLSVSKYRNPDCGVGAPNDRDLREVNNQA